jgi:hypothetical protein
MWEIGWDEWENDDLEAVKRIFRADNLSISASAYEFNDFTCTVCARSGLDASQWEQHIESKAHRKLAQRILETGSIEPPSNPNLSKKRKEKANCHNVQVELKKNASKPKMP